MKWKTEILNLKAYQPGKSIDEVKKKYGLEKITKLASNENPFGCSPVVEQMLMEYKPVRAIYPDGYAASLRQTVADHLDVSEKQLIFGNGSDEVIQIISRGLLKPGVNTVMPSPSFPQYRHNAIIEGAEVREIALINGEHDLEGMLNAIDENTSVVWVCSPNNPTGCYINQSSLHRFLSQIPADVLVVLDEAYYEYVVSEDYYDALSLVKEFSNLIVLRTFSKVYGLASFRVGYGVGNENIIQALEPLREPFNTNVLGQAAAAAALQDQEFVENCKRHNRKGLEQFYSFCDEAGLNYFPSQGNFVLIDFNRDGDEVFHGLLAEGYIVRSGKALGFPTSVRVTVGSEEQNIGVIEAMKKLLASN
ncbi:histidinol-phosphate transaminase [Falsibacillus pallidus]|uniref:Histidinol-phosphate aminotransferase n=1 Tax=Falsibacillus pallidus TaxID=493781 RepID=A0A370GIG1_9BACI|nr:histidinol-phosphate transaminase [Falsibacillus pallidus]RDI42996.1 histidinol-phosphate aminotransferase [Falsibacillus pallidus]